MASGGGTGNGIGGAAAAHEVPVKAGVAGVDLPVVARGAVPAPADIGNFNLLGEGRIETVVSDAVDVGVDRVAGRIYVDGECRRLGQRDAAERNGNKNQRDSGDHLDPSSNQITGYQRLYVEILLETNEL